MMAKHNTSENMKALQKRYIPANIFVAILAFVAALATLFLPWLDVRVQIDGEKLYTELKKRGILVRHFSKESIRQYNRITIGTAEQMQTLIENISLILEENRK